MPYQEISATELNSILNNETPIRLIDVRDEFEYEDRNIGGLNLPMKSLFEALNTFEEDEVIYLVCKSGKRSKAVAYNLTRHYPHMNIYSLAGGLNNYLTVFND